MKEKLFYFEISIWWIVPALIFCAGMIYLMYSKKGQPWSKSTGYLLGTIRLIALISIFILLFNPFLNRSQNSYLDPIVPVLIDNSTSVLQNHDSTEIINKIERLRQLLVEKGYEPKVYTLDGNPEPIFFQNRTTNIKSALDRIDKLENNNQVGAKFLISDGINNRGFSPIYYNSLDPIYTIGLGDSTAKIDIGIAEVRYNDIVYKGNKFPVEVLLEKAGKQEVECTVTIKENGELISDQKVTLTGNKKLDFTLEPVSSGLNKYEIQVSHDETDEIKENNTYIFYSDVIEAKDKILLVAASPHPDIRAIRLALEKKDNYETSVYIPRVSEPALNESYDVYIYHTPDQRGFPALEINENASIWYISNSKSLATELSIRTGIKLESPQRNQTDDVRPAYNNSFSKFEITSEQTERFANYPTIQVPYGDYSFSGPVEVLLYQKVGNVTTSRPLMSFYDDGSRKNALLLGTGFWKWRLQEAAIEGNAKNFDELVSKTVQLLSIRNDKKLLRVEPVKRVSNYGENIQFKIETYNDIYERTGGKTVELILTSEDENTDNTLSFTYTSDPSRNTFSTGILEAGIYRFEAITRIGEKMIREKGEFLVRDVQIEKLNTQADFSLLRNLATNSNGTFISFNNERELERVVNELELSGKIETSQSFVPLINLLWISILIILLMSIEWFFRKYLGSY